jgi:hypothetical protein
MAIYQCFKKTSPNSLTEHNLVLDIDDTLVQTFEDIHQLYKCPIMKNSKYYPVRKRLYILNFEDSDEDKESDDNKVWGVKRPHIEDFLIFATQYFRNVVIWSAGTYDYVHSIVKNIFKNLPCPTKVFTRNDCFQSEEFGYEKPLQKVFSQIPEMNSYNTFLIDDRQEVFSRKDPDNGIIIPPFSPDINDLDALTNDTCFLDLKKWFMLPEVMEAYDVRELDKRTIFTQEN